MKSIIAILSFNNIALDSEMVRLNNQLLFALKFQLLGKKYFKNSINQYKLQ